MNWYRKTIKTSKKLHDNDISVIKDLLEQGHPAVEVASLYGVSPSYIYSLIRNKGWKVIRQPNSRKLSDNDIALIKDLVEQGRPIKEIANSFEVDISNIYYLIKHRGWKFNRNQRTYEEIIQKDKEIASLYLLPPLGQGLTAREIARRLDIRQEEVPNALRRMGLESHLRNRSEVNSSLWNDPEYRKKMEERNIDPLYVKNMSEKHKKIWEKRKTEPGYIDRVKKYWEDHPELKNDMSIRKKQYWENMPGGFWEWLNKFSPEKQQEILNAIRSKNKNTPV